MVSSSAIPKEMLKMMAVLTFRSTPKKPMTPAMNTRGTRFGIKATKTIRQSRKNQNMMRAVRKTASPMPRTSCVLKVSLFRSIR